MNFQSGQRRVRYPDSGLPLRFRERGISRLSGRWTLIVFPTAAPQVLLQSSDCGRDSIRVMALCGP
jgi:hypothetical protein